MALSYVLQNLPKALLLALLVGAPVMGQTVTWEASRDFLLGSGRNFLMYHCGLGKQLNQRNESYWANKKTIAINKKFNKENGEELTHAMTSGLSNAMAVVCPNVW